MNLAQFLTRISKFGIQQEGATWLSLPIPPELYCLIIITSLAHHLQPTRNGHSQFVKVPVDSTRKSLSSTPTPSASRVQPRWIIDPDCSAIDDAKCHVPVGLGQLGPRFMTPINLKSPRTTTAATTQLYKDGKATLTCSTDYGEQHL